MERRAYSTLQITKADREQRIVEGICSTPETDLAGDQVLPSGARWKKLPLPFLWQHSRTEPLGHVEHIEVRPSGIFFRARLVKVNDPPSLKDKLDSCWAMIRDGLVRGISIGFLPTRAEPISTGMRFLEWTLNEISAVTIPCNESATVSAVKHYAKPPTVVVKLNQPVGVPRKALPVVKLGQPFAPALPANANAAPVCSAMLDAIEEERSFLEKISDRKSMGNDTQNLLSNMMSAGAKATDVELAALRERLDRLERKQ